MVGKATPDRGGPRKSPDGVDSKTSGWASKRTRKTLRDGHNSGVKIWSLCSVSSTLSHANLEQPFRTLAIKREVKYNCKEVFLRLPSCVLYSCVLYSCVCRLSCVCYHCVSMYPVYVCVFLHESADDNATFETVPKGLQKRLEKLEIGERIVIIETIALFWRPEIFWELIFIYCGLFVLILVVFVLFLLSLRFGQISPLAFFRWFTGDTVTRLIILIRGHGKSPEEGQRWNLAETLWKKKQHKNY